MPNDPYLKTSVVTSHETDATAQQFNSLMAEMKAAAMGIMTHNYEVDFTYAGGSDNDLLDTITMTDNSPAGDAGFDITLVGTITYDANDMPSEIEWVFDSGEMNITMTETLTLTDSLVTNVAGVTS